MTSAVEALLEGHTPAIRHGKRSAYRAMCACCAPESDIQEGKPQRQASKRPLLAWRTRLAQQQSLAGALDDTTI